jgi:hypothetical protein
MVVSLSPDGWCNVGTHQSTLGAVKSMPVVPPELGVGSLERGVTVGLGLLDTVFHQISYDSTAYASVVARDREDERSSCDLIMQIDRACAVNVREAYPFLWFFLD